MDCYDYTGRSQALWGPESQQILQRSAVLVVGLGGVGGAAAEALARAGIGQLTLVDEDVIERSNLNRQLIALHSTIGASKAKVAAVRLQDINPQAQITAHQLHLDGKTKEGFTALPWDSLDFIVDAIDDVPAKIALAEEASKRKIPLIMALGAGRRWQPEKLIITDLFATQGDPLARRLRHDLRQRGISSLPVVFSEEAPKPLPVGGPLPSSPFVPPAAGFLLASYVVRSILGLE